MSARYTARPSTFPGSPWWYIHDRVLNDEADWSPGAEVECGICYTCPGYNERQARAVADWLNAHDTTNPADIPTPRSE